MPIPPLVLVDDDRSWVQATADLLREEGFEVHTAEDGENGLEVIHQVRPLLAVIDVNLPKLSGLELLRELRRENILTPTIIVSSDDRSSVISQAMGLGAAAFLRKPLAPGLLLRAIRRLTTSTSAENVSTTLY